MHLPEQILEKDFEFIFPETISKRSLFLTQTSFASGPFSTCFLISLPLVVIGFLIMGICTAERVDDDKADDGARPAVTQGKRSATKHSEAKKKD